MRTPQFGQKTPTFSLPLSAMRVKVFVSPVTWRLSFGTIIDMPKALPDWRWHSLQWQATTRIGAAVSVYRTDPHWHPPVYFGCKVALLQTMSVQLPTA